MGYRQQASGKTARDRPCKTLLTASESHTSTAARGRAICASLGAPSPHLLNRAQASRRGPIRLAARPSLLASRAGGVGPSEACRQAARMSKAANPSAHRHRRELLLSPVAHASTVREPRHPAARREQSDPREAARGVPSAEPGARARAGADASWPWDKGVLSCGCHGRHPERQVGHAGDSATRWQRHAHPGAGADPALLLLPGPGAPCGVSPAYMP